MVGCLGHCHYRDDKRGHGDVGGACGACCERPSHHRAAFDRGRGCVYRRSLCASLCITRLYWGCDRRGYGCGCGSVFTCRNCERIYFNRFAVPRGRLAMVGHRTPCLGLRCLCCDTVGGPTCLRRSVIMFYAIQWIRSLIYAIQMYVMMFVIGGVGLPFALFNRKAVYFTIHAYCRWVMWTAGWMVGIKTEIRGTVPDEEILIAAKHQSFLDVLMIGAATPRPKFILKSSLMYMPILAQYAKLTGSVP